MVGTKPRSRLPCQIPVTTRSGFLSWENARPANPVGHDRVCTATPGFLSPKALDDELGMPKQTRSDAERELKRYGWLTHVGLTGHGYDKYLLTLGW